MVGLIGNTQYERTSNTLKVFDRHAPIVIGDNRAAFRPGKCQVNLISIGKCKIQP